MKWLADVIESGEGGADCDVKEMLSSLQNASDGSDIAENLSYVSEFCEVNLFEINFFYNFPIKRFSEKFDRREKKG